MADAQQIVIKANSRCVLGAVRRRLVRFPRKHAFVMMSLSEVSEDEVKMHTDSRRLHLPKGAALWNFHLNGKPGLKNDSHIHFSKEKSEKAVSPSRRSAFSYFAPHFEPLETRRREFGVDELMRT